MNDLNLRSEEVQEILGTPPHWLVRWGILAAFAILIGAAYLAFYIEYPRSVHLEGKVFNEEPTRELKATNTVQLDKILIANEDTVENNQVLLVYRSNGEFTDVLSLENYLMTLEQSTDDSTLLYFEFPRDLVVGDLQEDFYDFLDLQENIRTKYSSSGDRLTNGEIDRQIRNSESQIYVNRREQENFERLFRNAERDYQRLTNLRAQGKANDYQVRQAESLMLSYERFLQEKENNIRFHRSNIRNLRSQLQERASVSSKSKDREMQKLRDNLSRLQSAIKAWKSDNLLEANTGGIVVFSDLVKPDAYVEEGDKLAEIRSATSSSLIGKTKVSLKQSGLIEPGQKVLLDFYSFPAAQNGYVEGVVAEKGKVPTGETLSVVIRFPDGLVTNTGQTLAVGENMLAKMEIVVAKKRVLEWLFQK